MSIFQLLANFNFKKPALSGLVLILLLPACNKTEETVDDGQRPEENRFTTTVMTQPGKLDEPMAMTFTGDGQLLIAERKGNVKSYNTKTGELKKIGFVPVNTKYTSREGDVREAEEGLMGIVADPDFKSNKLVYMYYADPQEKKHVLGRWELVGDSLDSSTRKIILEIPTQREVCCHTGGGMTFDKNGNLYLTTGNNTANPNQGTSALDERPERENWDDQRTAGNTNDLRGKIIRIHPKKDGSYTIPEGNLFPKGTDKTRPEIYTMGHRNPWRISIDNETGYIYWGEVGPDASKDSTIGPRGYDEFNQAKAAGFFGWPYFIGDNKPYADYDYATGQIGENFDPQNPVNNSPNNTGLNKLPPPQKAFIWYPYSNSEEFPLVGAAGRSATGGPVFRKANFEKTNRRFPSYFEGKWLIVEFMRGWIMAVTMDENGNFKSMEQFLPKENFSSAIDMQFSPEGDLYVLEYGSAWFRGNENAQIKKIEYNGGNRKPIARATADKLAGALPLNVKLSSEGTVDYDKDELTYQWTVKSDNGFSKTFKEQNPELSLDNEGVYSVTLDVTDAQNETTSQTFELKAGNEPPAITIDILKGNKTFFFPDASIDYSIDVADKEDGRLSDGTIPKNEVAINFDYAPEGFDPIEIAQNHVGTDEWTTFSKGANLISKSDCKSCHILDKKSVGPSYLDVANKYKNDTKGQERIAGKIITGGSGVWGDHAMSAHPQVSKEDAAKMVQYIISLASQQKQTQDLPAKGTFVTQVPKEDNGRGGYLLRVAYKDKGTPQLGSLTSEKIIALRNTSVNPEKADVQSGTQLLTTPTRSFNMVGNGSHLGYRSIDLTGIQQIQFVVQAQPRSGAIGGVIEVHLDAPDGKLLGQTGEIVPKDVDFRAAMAKLNAANAGKKRPAGQAAPPIDFNALRKMMSTTVQAAIENTEGQHDIYFVFRNSQAKEKQIIVQMMGIEFQNQQKDN
jgi:cytochrome c